MVPDDSEVDSSADAAERTDTPGDETPAPSGPRDLPARLSETVPSRRAYGMERIAAPDGGGLLTPRERQYLRQAERLDQGDRDAVETVVSERVGEFVDADWPVIEEHCPEVAEALRQELCGGSD